MAATPVGATRRRCQSVRERDRERAVRGEEAQRCGQGCHLLQIRRARLNSFAPPCGWCAVNRGLGEEVHLDLTMAVTP